MSEKEKRDVVSTEKSDAVRFRDIVKISDDIMKTAYPTEEIENEETEDTVEEVSEEEIPEKNKSINPFTEGKKPKGKLDAEFSPDGKILVEDDPDKEKKDKVRDREKKKTDKIKAKQGKRREKLLAKIRKLEPQLTILRDKKVSTEDPKEFQKWRKKEERLTKKINELNQRAVSPDQYTPSSGFYIKARFFRMWVIILIVLVLIIVALSAALISMTYKNLKHYQGDSQLQRQSVNALNSEVSNLNDEMSNLNDEKNSVSQEKSALEQKIGELNGEISGLNGKISELNEEISNLEKDISNYKYEIDQLEIKTDFLDDHIRIVNGNFFKKTYHVYGCTKADYSSYWAYNKEQVEGKVGYSACSHCIK